MEKKKGLYYGEGSRSSGDVEEMDKESKTPAKSRGEPKNSCWGGRRGRQKEKRERRRGRGAEEEGGVERRRERRKREGAYALPGTGIFRWALS